MYLQPYDWFNQKIDIFYVKRRKIFDQIVLVLASLRKNIVGKFPQTRQMATLRRTINTVANRFEKIIFNESSKLETNL